MTELEFKRKFSDLQSTALSQSHENEETNENQGSKEEKWKSQGGGEHSLDGAGGLQVQHNKSFWAAKIIHYRCELPGEISLSAEETTSKKYPPSYPQIS